MGSMVWILMHFMFVWQFVFVYISYRLWNYIRHKHKFPERQPFRQQGANEVSLSADGSSGIHDVEIKIPSSIPVNRIDKPSPAPQIHVKSQKQPINKAVSANWDFADQDNDFEDSDMAEKCCICLSKKRTMAMVPCGHKCLCSDVKCHGGIVGKACPICRQKVSSVMRIFD